MLDNKPPLYQYQFNGTIKSDFIKGGLLMALKKSSVSVNIPKDILPLISDLANGKSVDENVRI